MRICVPIIAETTGEAVERMGKAQLQADILELRLDLISSFDIALLVKATSRPVIATYRSEREGGRGTCSPDRVVEYLTCAAGEGAEYIDVESTLPIEHRKRIFQNRKNSMVILSRHFMDRTPERDELEAIYRKGVSEGADIVKIVTMASGWNDNLRVLELVNLAQRENVKIIAFCMGGMGRMSRVFSPLMGGFLTFASLEEGLESAPGQVPVGEMKQMLEYFGNNEKIEPWKPGALEL